MFCVSSSIFESNDYSKKTFIKRFEKSGFISNVMIQVFSMIFIISSNDYSFECSSKVY